MGNPLYDMMGGSMPPIVQQFLQFKQSFRGDPQAQIQQMLSSGRISQSQYDQAVQQAKALQQMLTLVGRK